MAHNLKKNVFSVFNRLNEYRKEGKFCDVKLIVESIPYPCHRNILSASCKYFEIMFNSSFQEGLGLSDEISIGDIDTATFETIIEFIYTHRAKITKENAYFLLRKSNFFDLVDLERRCTNYILDTPSVHHLLEICEFANTTKKDSFFQKTIVMVAADFKRHSKSENFSNLSYEVFKSILQALQRIVTPDSTDDDDETRESEKLIVIMDWVKKNVEERTGYLEELLTFITLPAQFHGILTNTFLDYVSNVVQTDSECLGIFCATTTNKNRDITDISLLKLKNENWIWKKNVAKETLSFRIVNAEKENYYLTYSRNDDQPINHFFNDKNEDNLQPPPIYVSSYAITSVSSTIFLYNYSENFLPLEKTRSWISFEMEDARLEHMFVYNILQNKWFSTPPIPEYLYNSYMVSLNNLVYLIGGTKKFDLSKGGFRNIIQTYDSRSSRWTQSNSNMPLSLNGAACVLGNKIYICERSRAGNVKNSNPLMEYANALHVYDTAANKWETRDIEYEVPLPYALIPYKSKLWTFGYDAGMKGAIYYPKANAWSEMPKFPEKLLTTYGNAIILRTLGGIVV